MQEYKKTRLYLCTKIVIVSTLLLTTLTIYRQV